MSTIAQRAKGTPFEILYAPQIENSQPVMTARELAVERNRIRNRDRRREYSEAKKREAQQSGQPDAPKRTGAMRDNKQYANWTLSQ